MPKVIRTIIIEECAEYVDYSREPRKSITVRCGELWEDSLTSGEALECIARFLFTGTMPYLQGKRQHDRRRQRHGYYGDDGFWVEAEGVRP